MARPKKKIQKREKVFNAISSSIDYVQDSWINIFKISTVTSVVLFAVYMILIWMPTVERVIFEIRYY